MKSYYCQYLKLGNIVILIWIIMKIIWGMPNPGKCDCIFSSCPPQEILNFSNCNKLWAGLVHELNLNFWNGIAEWLPLICGTTSNLALKNLLLRWNQALSSICAQTIPQFFLNMFMQKKQKNMRIFLKTDCWWMAYLNRL